MRDCLNHTLLKTVSNSVQPAIQPRLIGSAIGSRFARFNFAGWGMTLTGFLLVLGIVLVGTASAQNPVIDFHSDAPTNAAYRQGEFAFRMKEIQLYPRHTKDPKPAREKAQQFLKSAACWLSDVPWPQRVEPARVESIVALGREVVSLGSKDPLVLRYQVEMNNQTIVHWDAEAKINESIRLFDQSDYPAALKFEYFVIKVKCVTSVTRLGKKHAALEACYQAMPAFLHHVRKYPYSRRVCYDRVKSVLLSKELLHIRRSKTNIATFLRDSLKRIDSKKYRVDPWLLQMLWGEVDFGEAISARHPYRDRRMPAEIRTQFREHLARAAKHFQKAFRIRPQEPESAGGMVACIQFGHPSKDSIWDWFQKSIDAEIDYLPAYYRLLDKLSPRWGGTSAAHNEFLMQCADSERYDTRIPILFESQLENRTWQLRDDSDTYIVLQEVLELTANHPSNQLPKEVSKGEFSGLQTRLLTKALLNAVLAEEFEDAKRFAEKLDGEIDSYESQRWFQEEKLSSRFVKSRINAYVAFPDELKELEPLFEKRGEDFYEIEELNSAVKELLNRDVPGTQRFLKTWVRTTQQEMDFLDGQWVDLEFDDDVDLWIRRGNVSIDDGLLTLDSRQGGLRISATSRGHFIGPCEIEVEIVDSPKVNPIFGVGIFRGRDFTSTSHWIVMGARLEGGHATIQSHQGVDLNGHQRESSPPMQKLAVMYWGDERVEMRINGVLHPITKANASKYDLPRVGITSLPWRFERGTATFKKFRIKQMTIPTPPDTPAESIKYYTNLIETYPNRIDYYYSRGLAHRELNQLEQAIGDFENARSKLLGNLQASVDLAIAEMLFQSGKKKASKKLLGKLVRKRASRYSRHEQDVAQLACCLAVNLMLGEDKVPATTLKAVEIYAQHAIKYKKNVEAHCAMARLESKKKNLDGASEHLKKAKALAKSEQQQAAIAKVERELFGEAKQE